jgi:hypothetical protein
VLEDEHYEHGDDGQDTYEHLGPILVRGAGCWQVAAARAHTTTAEGSRRITMSEV